MKKNCSNCKELLPKEFSHFCPNCSFKVSEDKVKSEKHNLGQGVFFSGELQDQSPFGYGILTDSVKDIYGEFFNGQVIGIGKIIYHKKGANVWYVGEIKNNKPNGYGKEFYGDGISYRKGNWEDGKMNGHGERKIGFASIITGNFRNGEVEGYGKEIFSTGGRYEGNFIKTRRTGKGKEVFTNGAVYEGDFQDGCPIGTGFYVSPDGFQMRGHFSCQRGPVKGGTARFYHVKDESGKVYFGHIHSDGRFESKKLKRFFFANKFFEEIF